MQLSTRWFRVHSEPFTANREQAFTLIELVVSIAIVGLLIGVAIPSLNSFNKSQTLQNTQEEVKSAFRLAQSKAVSTEIDRLTCDVTKSSLVGWYVKIEQGSSSYDVRGRCIPDQNNPTFKKDFSVRSFKLPKDHVFSSVSPQSPTYILFKPLSSQAKFYGQELGGNELENLDNDTPLAGVSQMTLRISRGTSMTGPTVVVKSNGEII